MNDVTIICTGGGWIGRCYTATHYRVQAPRELTQDDWDRLRATRRLGYGQEFYTRSLGVLDGLHTYEAEDRVDSGD